jgi:FkbM family methyltransferase
MPHFNLRHFLEELGDTQGEDITIVQIGAMDGKTFDPVHEYITRFGWRGLMVEPIKEHFETLKKNYAEHPNIAFANVAIAEKAGVKIMHRIPTQHVVDEEVPKWGVGVASFYADRNALAFEEVQAFIIEEEVQCQTLPEVLREHNINQIDILQIDAEGHDYHILKQLDFSQFKPKVINLEIVNLPKEEKNEVHKLLDAQGYLYIKAGYDLFAVLLEE